MVYEVIRTKRFKIAYKKVSKLQGFKKEVFASVVETLAAGKTLEAQHRDHKLTGNLKAFRECHLDPDILLIYQIDDGVLVLTLVSIGNYAQLFR